MSDDVKVIMNSLIRFFSQTACHKRRDFLIALSHSSSIIIIMNPVYVLFEVMAGFTGGACFFAVTCLVCHLIEQGKFADFINKTEI